MSRGYRCAILAVVGWLILCGQNQPAVDSPQPRQTSVQEQRASDTQEAANTIASAIENTIQPAPKDEGCQDRSDKRGSDLCAQWKAADAARNAADYALWTLIISAIGTGLLVWTLWETRRTSRRQLRAYVVAEPAGILDGNGDKPSGFQVSTLFHNMGQTPAYDVRCSSAIAISSDPTEFNGGDHLDKIHQDIRNDFLGPGQERYAYGGIPELEQKTLKAIRDRRAALIHYGVISYSDAFGASRTTNFAFYHWGPELSTEAAMRCRYWNNAT